MIRSTFISFGLHSFLLTLAYFGLPALKTKEPIELPIDIVEDTPISSKTSLKLGDNKEKKLKKINKKIEKEEKIKKNGELYIQEREIDTLQLLPRLKAISSGNKNLRIYVRGDKDVPYGLVLDTIAKIKSSGFKKVALVAKLQEG